MNYSATRNAYLIGYCILGYGLLAFELAQSHRLLLKQWPEAAALTLLLVAANFFDVPLPRTHITVIPLYPLWLLGILMMRSLFVVPNFLAELIWATAKAKHFRPLPFLVSPVRLMPGILLSNAVYTRMGGGEFSSLSQVPWVPLTALAFTLVFLDGLGLNIQVALSQGVPPWRWRISLVQYFDVLFAPLAIPAYLLYQSGGNKALLILLVPLFGGLWFVRQFFLEASRRQQSMEHLDVANELIRSQLDVGQMVRKAAEKVSEILKPDGVEVFLLDKERWGLVTSLGKSPWMNQMPPESLLKILESLPEKQPVLIRDICGDSRFAAYEKVGLLSILLIPLLSGEKTIGLILCSKSTQDYFYEDHLDFSRALMGQLSQALLGAQLHERLAKTLEELRATQAQLIHSEKMAGLGKLVAGVAHELNNPLNFLTLQLPALKERVQKQLELLEAYEAYAQVLPGEDRGLLEKLRESLGLQSAEESYVKLFAALEEGTRRAKQIVDELRTFARTEKVEESWDYLNLPEALESTLTILSPLYKNRIAIHKAYRECPPLWCNPAQMNQVFMNVLSNAFEAIEGTGDVWLETTGADGQVKVTIKDSGRGIAPEIQKRIFEPFFTTKEVGRGTGLGLSIVYGIVERHHGEIQVESQTGKGTTFRLIFPNPHDEGRRHGAA